MNRRQRGSAMLLTIMLTVSTTTVVTAVATLSVQSGITEARILEHRKAHHAFEGAAALVEHEYYQSPVTLPATRNYSIGQAHCEVTLTDNSSSILRTLLATCTVSIGHNKYKFRKVFGTREVPKPSYYALFINGSDWSNDNITTGTGGQNGDVCVNGDIPSHPGTHMINGDLECAGTIRTGGITVTGERRQNMPVIPFPEKDRQAYEKSATSKFSQSQDWTSGVNFVPGKPLIYIIGDLKIRGAVVGKGTIYVTGKIEITGTLSYASTDDVVVFIAEEDIVIKSLASSFVGYYFTFGHFNTEGASAKILALGGIVCHNKLTLSGPITIIHDPRVWTDPGFGARYKIPGFWP